MMKLQDLVAAVLEWEQADAARMRLADSKSANPADLKAADQKLIAAIKRLRLVARELRKAMKSPLAKKPKTPIDWGKILDVSAKVVGTLKDLKDGGKVEPIRARVIDATPD
jgi:hypothetical protein